MFRMKYSHHNADYDTMKNSRLEVCYLNNALHNTLHNVQTDRSFATGVTTQNLALLSYWYRKKRLQVHFERGRVP